MAHDSDSTIQRDAERSARDVLAKALGKPLAPRTVRLGGGALVQVDAVAADESVFAEILAHHGPLKGGQRHKIATDALKLITIARDRPSAALILAFLDHEAAEHATRGTWLAEALAVWNIRVTVIEVEARVRDAIRAAQTPEFRS